jgi:CheY-like chemotaxis protein
LLKKRCVDAQNQNQNTSSAAERRAESFGRRTEAGTPKESHQAFQAKISEIRAIVNQNIVSLLIVDNSDIVRKAIKGLLAQESSIQILGEAEDLKNAISMAALLKPDVILLDLHMRDDSVYEPEFVKNQFVNCGSRVLAMTFACQQDEESKKLATGFGAITLLDKTDLYDMLIPAIKQAPCSQNHSG